MSKSTSISGMTLELVERGHGRPTLVPARWRRARAGAAMAPTAVPELSGYRAVASGLWQLAADRRVRFGRRSRLSLPRPRFRVGAPGRGAGRRMLWRLDRRGDDGAVDGAIFKPRIGRSAWYQDQRPRGAGHCRHAWAAAGRVSEAGLGRS